MPVQLKDAKGVKSVIKSSSQLVSSLFKFNSASLSTILTESSRTDSVQVRRSGLHVLPWNLVDAFLYPTDLGIRSLWDQHLHHYCLSELFRFLLPVSVTSVPSLPVFCSCLRPTSSSVHFLNYCIACEVMWPHFQILGLLVHLWSKGGGLEFSAQFKYIANPSQWIKINSNKGHAVVKFSRNGPERRSTICV